MSPDAVVEEAFAPARDAVRQDRIPARLSVS